MPYFYYLWSERCAEMSAALPTTAVKHNAQISTFFIFLKVTILFKGSKKKASGNGK